MIKNYLDQIKTPCYVLEEKKLIKNLELLQSVERQSGAKILLALKGFALQDSFPLIKKYLSGASSSGLWEAKMANKIGKEVHTYSPAFCDEDIDEVLDISSHVVFNSFSQWQKFKTKASKKASCGIRVNPQTSFSPVELYNPCGKFSRLGVSKKEFRSDLLDGVDGFHVHALCEQNADALQEVMKKFEESFGEFLPRLKWVNFGGGHHITRADYDVNLLIKLLKDFKAKYSHLEVFLEPSEAVGWQSGDLVASVLDIVKNEMNIAILDVSAEAHMPDTLAMPYRALVDGASEAGKKAHSYRLAGNTCLAGDIMGDYSFNKALKVGDKLIFKDQIHYTIVKNTTFNGVKLPSLAKIGVDGEFKVIKEFGFDEYERRN